PMTDAPDEIGDLARSFEKLFVVVGGYTDYLRTLASKLSHELNTPLAIVKSSLDNLEHALQERAALPDQAVPYLARARDGVARLGALVRAMRIQPDGAVDRGGRAGGCRSARRGARLRRGLSTADRDAATHLRIARHCPL